SQRSMRSGTPSLSRSTAGQRKHGALGSTFSSVSGSCANAGATTSAASMTNRPRRGNERAVTANLRAGDRLGLGRTVAHRLASLRMTRIPHVRNPRNPAARLMTTALLLASLARPTALHATCAAVPKAPLDADSPAEVMDRPARAWTFDRWVDSKPLTLDSLRGKVVLIRWFNTGCKYCGNTLPGLESLRTRYAS